MPGIPGPVAGDKINVDGEVIDSKLFGSGSSKLKANPEIDEYSDTGNVTLPLRVGDDETMVDEKFHMDPLMKWPYGRKTKTFDYDANIVYSVTYT